MNLEKKKNFIINFAYFVVWLVIIFLIFRFAIVYLSPFIIGVFLAYFVQKPAVVIARNFKIKKQLCAAVLSVVFYILLVVFFILFFYLMYSQLIKVLNLLSVNGDLSKKLDNFFNVCLRCIKNTSNNFSDEFYEFVSKTKNNFILKFSNFLSNVISMIVKKIPNLIISVVITVVASCYISKDFDKLKKFVFGFVDNKVITKIVDVKKIFTECFFKFTFGYFLLYLITLFELLLGLMLLQIRSFILLSFIIAFVDILPIFGTGTVLLPWSIFEISQRNYSIGFGLMIMYGVIIVVRNFLEPKIIGKQIGINPLFTLIFIFLGLRIGGIVGMIIIPIVLTVIFTYYRKQINVEND